MYISNHELIQQIFQNSEWGDGSKFQPGPDICPDSDINYELLQSTVRLADKLDCREIIDQIQDNASKWEFVWYDPLGWVIVGRNLKLYKITSAALDALTRSLSIRPTTAGAPIGIPIATPQWEDRLEDCHNTLADKRWLELDPQTFMLIMEAKTMYNLKDLWTWREDTMILKKEILENYDKPGDIFISEFPQYAAETEDEEEEDDAVEPEEMDGGD